MAEQDQSKFLKLRLEQCEDGGWFMVTHEVKGEIFVGRKVFTSTNDLCDYLIRKFGDSDGNRK